MNLDLPVGESIVYHLTLPENLPDIQDNGIKKSYTSDKWEIINEFLESVAEQEHIGEKPRSRAECVFSYGRYADVHDVDSLAVICIDVEKIPNVTLYGASYNTATKIDEIFQEKQVTSGSEVLDLQILDKEYNNAVDLAKEYWTNCTELHPPIKRGGEILIESDVPSQAIVHIYSPDLYYLG